MLHFLGFQSSKIGYLKLDTFTGYLEVKKVDIQWEDQRSPTLHSGSGSSGLFLKVILSESCKAGKGWSFLQEACVPVMDLIDWERSHPDSNFDVLKAYGVDAAWKYFLAVRCSAIPMLGSMFLAALIVTICPLILDPSCRT